MPKFSIIIPVYNSEKYLKKCLDSVLNQSYKDYEIIVVNDCSTDDSQLIINSYGDEVKCIELSEKKGIGPSYARNVGISKASGDYMLFLDGDDFYESDLLYQLNESLDANYDLVRFEIQYDIGGSKSRLNGCSSICSYDSGIDAFNSICNYAIVESPCCYAFRRGFFLNNDFKFKENTLHEDFGLIPLIILKASSVKCIDYVGYNYVVHDNSIMTSNDYDKVVKKANDFLIHFKFLLDECSNLFGDLSIFRSYIANSVILKSTTLNGNDYKNYIKELKKLGAFDMLLSDSLGRKIKKNIIRFGPKLYYKLVRR